MDEEKVEASQEEIQNLKGKISSLETVIDVLTSKNSLLEKEIKRLEYELNLEQEQNLVKREEVLLERERRITDLEIALLAGHGHAPILKGNELQLVQESQKDNHVEMSASSTPAIEGINSILATMELKLKEIGSCINTTTLRIKKREIIRHRLAANSKTKKRKNDIQTAIERLKRRSSKIPDNKSIVEDELIEDEPLSMEEDEDDTDSIMSSPGKSSNFDMFQIEMVLEKLDKLDKLDEVLRKLDSIKIQSGAVNVATWSGRSYSELKTELEYLMAIIFDETYKYSSKEIEDANIKYEKVSQELEQTDEYKGEIAAALEEKRKKNEPLNREALERMKRIYNADSFVKNPEIIERVKKSPELTLIGMDPKVILSKHQNDFNQYFLRSLDLEELRAIRGSLPKFRPDQRKQIDWCESLEAKIEQWSLNPPKQAALPKARTLSKFKRRRAPSGLDLFKELLTYEPLKMSAPDEEPLEEYITSEKEYQESAQTNETNKEAALSWEIPLPPPVPSPPRPPVSKLKLKPRRAPSINRSDVFAELTSKRKKLGIDDGSDEPQEKKEEVKLGALRLAPKAVKANAPPPPLSAPKPPPPPPPILDL